MTRLFRVTWEESYDVNIEAGDEDIARDKFYGGEYDGQRFRDITNVDIEEVCPKYPQDKVLPNEDGKCSLCGEHDA